MMNQDAWEKSQLNFHKFWYDKHSENGNYDSAEAHFKAITYYNNTIRAKDLK